MPNFILNKKNFDIDINNFYSLESNQKTVLNLWHIETFEGGSNSRSNFLEKCAIKFNAINPNCLIYVKTLTEEQLKLNLSENKKADIYSFGVGAGYLLSGELNKLEEPDSIRKELLSYSMLGENLLAYPYILSGYCLISKSADSSNLIDLLKANKVNNKLVSGVSIDGGSNINPSAILLENGIKGLEDNKDVNYFSSTYEAYCNFINGKSISLLGTTRDLVRCKNREEKGMLDNCSYKFFDGYSDLIQYVGVNTRLNEIKKEYAQGFAKFLTGNECQNELKNYSLFSCSYNKIYSAGYMSEFEDAICKLNKSINVFSDKNTIEEIKNKSKFSILS